MVFEVTSASTHSRDDDRKPELYAAKGVREINLFDPRGEMQPALQGLRAIDGALAAIEADASGAIESQELGLTLRVVAKQLIIADRSSGSILQTDAEAYAEQAAANDQRAIHAERRAADAEEANRKLKEALEAGGIVILTPNPQTALVG